METPSEWAKKFNRPKTSEEVVSPHDDATAVVSPTAGAEFPNEPFQCPACGQLLAPACRVCVACKHFIDPAEIRTSAVVLPAAHAASTEPKVPSVRFSWPIFFAVFGVACIIVFIFQKLWKDQHQVLLAMAGVEALAGFWVYFDARRLGVPRPLRWSMGTLFLPFVIFPWYLTRRRTPELPVPFMEAVPVTRLLLIAFLFFLLVNLIAYLVQGPPPTPVPKIQPRSSSPSRTTEVRPGASFGVRELAFTADLSAVRLSPPPVTARESGDKSPHSEHGVGTDCVT
jgi:hypothetical protein